MLPFVCRFEFKANHYEWLNTVRADFGPGILERLSEILMETCESIEAYNKLRIEFQAAIDALLEVSEAVVCKSDCLSSL